MIRVVTFDWRIVVVVVRVALLKKSPDHVVLVRTYVAAIERMKLDLLKQRALMADRAAVNIAFVRVLAEQYGLNGLNAPCNSHTVVRVGTYFNAPSCKAVMNKITLMFAHPGNARLVFFGEFSVAAKSGGGVRWWISWEQLLQILEIGGLEVFLARVARPCVLKAWSEESA